MKEFGDSPTLYEDPDVLEPDTETYQPEDLPERQDELDRLHTYLQPIETGSTPRDFLVYGPTGQGKTVAVQLKTAQLEAWADEEDVDLSVIHVSCKGADGSYHVLRSLVKELREHRKGIKGESAPQGYQKRDLLEMAVDELERIGGTILLILDEIDAIGGDDYVLYELPRAEVNGATLGLIGITNDFQFKDNLDPDVLSSLGDRSLTFSPYDADDLKNILARRAVDGLRDTRFDGDEETLETLESDVVETGVIQLAAAFAARDTGDAREAIRLLSHACDLAVEAGADAVDEDHVREARRELEQEEVAEGIKGETVQRKLALLAVVEADLRDDTPVATSEAYATYERYCEASEVDPNVQHTVRTKALNALAHGNLLDKTSRSRGRHGMTNLYELAVDPALVIETLAEEGQLADLINNYIEPHA